MWSNVTGYDTLVITRLVTTRFSYDVTHMVWLFADRNHRSTFWLRHDTWKIEFITAWHGMWPKLKHNTIFPIYTVWEDMTSTLELVWNVATVQEFYFKKYNKYFVGKKINNNFFMLQKKSNHGFSNCIHWCGSSNLIRKKF